MGSTWNLLLSLTIQETFDYSLVWSVVTWSISCFDCPVFAGTIHIIRLRIEKTYGIYVTSKSPVRSWLQFHDLRESTASLWVSLYWSIWGMNQTTRSSRCFHFKILRSYFLQTQKDEFIYIWKFYSSLFYFQGKNLRESSLFGYKYLHILFKKRLSISVKKG